MTDGRKIAVFDSSNLNVDNVKPFPSVEELACLSYGANSQEFGSQIICDISKCTKQPNIIRSLPHTWILIATAVDSSTVKLLNGYHGAAYYNESSKHIVIAHRGTKPSNIDSLYTDVVGVVCGKYTPHMKAAYQFTRQIVDEFWKCAISISVTGHSLGAWLSQTSAFFIKNPKLAAEFKMNEKGNLKVHTTYRASISSLQLISRHLHVVVFDSPGALNIIESHLLNYLPRYSDDRFLLVKYLDDVDVTTYFSSPNYVNSTNMHIGSMFMMPNLTDKKGLWDWTNIVTMVTWYFYSRESHSIENIIKFWQSDEEKTILKVTDWPNSLEEANLHHKKIQKFVNEETNTKFVAEPFNVNSVRMSVFDGEEREFLKDIYSFKEHGVIVTILSWKTMFEDKPAIAEANSIFSGGVFNDYTDAKDIFEFFDSVEIEFQNQVLNVHLRFKIEFFIRLVKYFVRDTNVNLRQLVKEVIAERPKVCQGIYRALSAEYLSRIPKVDIDDFRELHLFLESSQLKVYQVVAVDSTWICVAKILSVLKLRGFDMKRALLLNSDLLTSLDRRVGIERILPPKSDDLELILIENSDEEIQPTLKSLIGKVLEVSAPLVKLILVTTKKIDLRSFFDLQKENYVDKIIEECDQAISFEKLSIDLQHIVADSEICFQGEGVKLKNLVSLDELQLNPDALDVSILNSLLLQKRSISIGGILNTVSDFDRSCYIPRQFHKIVLKTPHNLPTELEEMKFILVVSYQGIDARNQIIEILFPKDVEDVPAFEWEGDFEGFIPERHKVILVESSTQSPSYYIFRSFFETINMTGSWLIYVGNKWYWQLNFGKRSMMNLEISYEERNNEEEMLQLRRPLVIVSDVPGAGKSTLLKKLAEGCKEVGRKIVNWVIFVNLESSVDLLKKECDDLASVTDILLQISESSSSKCLLKYLLQQEGRVTIFFDGLDEVKDEIKSNVVDITNKLLKYTKAKVFISSRLHLASFLESRLCTYTNKFVPLDKENRIEFLTKFWTGHPDLRSYKSACSDVIKTYASDSFENFESSLNTTEADSFVGVPMQLFMLGIIYLPHVGSFLKEVQTNSGSQIVPIPAEHNIFKLYQEFVGEKLRISLEDKLKVTQLSEHYPWHKKQLINIISELHRIISFFALFPNEYQMFQCSNKLSDWTDIEVLLGVGIVQKCSDDLSSIDFIHRSLADYFVADFLVSRLTMPDFREKVIEFLRNKFFHPQFDKIRFFVDHFISIQPECDPIFRKCLDWEKEKYFIFNEKSDARDLLNRNILHYAIRYGDDSDSGILWCLVKNCHLFNETDVFGCDFLSYVALLPDLLSIRSQTIFSWKQFTEYFASIQESEHPNFFWISWFSGRKAESLCKSLAAEHSVISQIEKFMEISNLLPDFSVTPLLKKPKMERQESQTFDDKYREHIFTDIVLRYLKSPEKCVMPFESAMVTGGYVHVGIASRIYADIRDDNLHQKLLEIMARDNFSLFKNSVEFIDSDIEAGLWSYCKNQKKEEEMFDAVESTKLLTFHRVWEKIELKLVPFVDQFFLKFYMKLENENTRKVMLDIVRDKIEELFDRFCSPTNKLLKFALMWKFLLIADKCWLLDKHYENLPNIHTFHNPSYDFYYLNFLTTLADSLPLDSYWRKKINADVAKQSPPIVKEIEAAMKPML